MVLVRNQPLIHFTLSNLVKAGFDQIIVTTNFMAGAIDNYLKKADFGVPVLCIEEKKAMGTAGCVKNVENLLTETFAVVPGDSIANIDLKALVDFHKNKKSVATLALVSVDNTTEYGIVQVDGSGRIMRYQEKPKPEESFSNLANTGYYILEPEVLKFIPSDEPFDFSFGLFPKLLEQNLPMYGSVTDKYWIDIGRVEKYIAGNKWLLRSCNSSCIASTAVIEEVLPQDTHIAVGEDSIIKKGAEVGNETVLGDRVVVEKGAKVSNSIIYPNTTIGASCKISDSIVGEDVRIDEEVVVEKNIIIGKGCHIARRAHIKPDSKVGPYFDVPPLAFIEGVASTFTDKGNTLQSYIERNPELSQLNREEMRMFGLLAEFGELPAKSLSSISNIPYSQVHKLLFSLQHRGLIVSYGEAPKLFALRYEYPERLRMEP